MAVGRGLARLNVASLENVFAGKRLLVLRHTLRKLMSFLNYCNVYTPYIPNTRRIFNIRIINVIRLAISDDSGTINNNYIRFVTS